MSVVRRALLVLVLALATVPVGSLAAWATFSDSAGSSTTIVTNRITAPTGVTATKDACSNQR